MSLHQDSFRVKISSRSISCVGHIKIMVFNARRHWLCNDLQETDSHIGMVKCKIVNGFGKWNR
jgi:hypothetical protein